jgi:hypothetical protein
MDSLEAVVCKFKARYPVYPPLHISPRFPHSPTPFSPLLPSFYIVWLVTCERCQPNYLLAMHFHVYRARVLAATAQSRNKSFS